MSSFELQIVEISGLGTRAGKDERPPVETKGKVGTSLVPAKFTLPSEIAIRKGIRNPLDLQSPKLPKLYSEPTNTLNQYARVDDAAHLRPSDRIGRNYTATSKMLTVDAINKSINPTRATSSDNPFSKADLQSIHVPEVLDPLAIPLRPGKGNNTMAPSPKRSNRSIYNSKQWQPELHGALTNSVGESKDTEGKTDADLDAKTNLRNFREAIDNESASQIMPIKKAWVLHCLSKVRKYQSAPGSQNILVACLQEIKDTYLQAVKTAIVNYKILSPRGARRALVDKNVLDELENWQPEQSRWNLHLTHQWRVLRETGIEEKSILDSKEKIWSIFNTLGSAMGRLQQLWLSRVGGIRLCDNRFTNFEHDIEFQRSLPLRMPEFSQRLLQEVTRVRSALKTSWLVASGFILTQHLKYYKEALHFNLFGSNANGNAGRTMAEMQREEKEMHAAEEVSLRSANVLMSRQLREIVEASINDLVQFIQKKRERKLSAITLNVLVSDAPIGADAKSLFELSPSINDILRSMEKCVDDIMDADKNFPSIELLVRPKADPKQPFLQACRVQLTDYVVEQAKGHLRTMIEDERATVEGSLDVLHQFADLFNGVEEEKCSKLLDTAIKATAPGSTKRILEKLDKEVTRYFALATKARNTLQPSAILPIFMVDCRDIISEIATRAENYADRLLETVVNKNRMQMKTVCDEFDKMQQMLLSNPEDSAKLQELQDYWAKCDDVMARLQKIIHAEIYAMTKFIFMHGQVDQSENGAHMYNDDTRLLIKVLEWPQKIKEFFEASKRMQDQRRDDLLGVLKLRKDTFTEETKEIDRKLTKLINQQDYSTDSVHSSLEMVTSLQDSLTEAFFEAERINAQENELQIDEGATDYEETLKKMRSKVEPLQQLWTLVGEYSSAMDQWMNNPLNTVDAEAADTTADNLRRGILKLKKQFDRMQIKQASSVAASISVELKTFLQDMIPLMTLICTPGLRDRHWDDINTITGLDIERNEGMSLFDLTPFHLEHYTDQIEETCVTAVKEFSLEKALINMEAEWDSINFTCKSYRETGTYILSEIDEVQQLLDDQVVKIQAMRSSRFIRPFASRASAWEKLLRNIEEIIENWLKVQGTWLYLEPIFSSDDIQKQMPAENERFKVVDGTWRESMSATAANPKVTDVAKTEGLVERLKEANVLLELIQKGLNDYLETKRLFFPRFFFLSNDELLEILAETKDPRRVQPHLKKCFEGINKLTFDEDLNILGMTSKEGEVVDFEYEQYNHRVVNPNDARGLVEQWLLDVETVMRKAVAYATDCSMEVYEKSVRTTWLKENPGMVVLATAMKVWTHDVEKALPEGTLQDVYDKMQSNLMDVVDMVRSKIPKIVRKAVGALCVIDVHNQSVVSTMIEENVRSPVEFTWLSQMRYYWNQGGPSATTGDPGSLECKMITSTILYAYEYLGLSMRLVITPLTDRCYRTMMGAIALNFGGAPEGPAGTGKTETVKDLAKTLAMLCVVFNCSDGLDFRAMAKFFKGLASAGAWACFDEFNRIELEVLSVVAQQILTIQRAKLAGQHEFFFEGTHLGLRHTANVYITMNPGYAGRSDLPDNLKALFRTVAMMVPDYGMIAEIMLYSMGYEKGKSLSVKIVQCYKLCSEQLSSQKHYDYACELSWLCCVQPQI
jgi:dynein heavy chain